MELIFLDPKEKNRKISNEVVDFSKDYKSILEDMKIVSLKKKAYGIAAPQVGIYERFILILTPEERTNKKEDEINYIMTPYFNPIIINKKGLQYFYEGCMSVPNAVGKVYRPYEIDLEAMDINGNKITKSVNGFEAIIFCHEIDHLDGIEYTDKAYDIRYDITYDDKIEIRKENPHTIINKDDNYEDLIKNINK